MDWSRFQLQLLFVDADDIGAARIAHGLFESIAEWNGYGRSLYPWSAGTNTRAQEADPSRTVSMMSQAESLGFSTRVFARSREKLDLNDFCTLHHSHRLLADLHMYCSIMPTPPPPFESLVLPSSTRPAR